MPRSETEERAELGSGTRGRSILLTGGTGLLGTYLRDALQRLGSVTTVARVAADAICDLREPAAVARLVETARPDMVVHAAALTDVELCEREPKLADAINHQSVRHLAAALSDNVPLVFISTDQVYPDCRGPHREHDVGPINVYGRSKLAGEEAALGLSRTLVLRTNIFGPSQTSGRASLSDFFYMKFKAGEPVMGFTDTLFSPLHMKTAAEAVAKLLEQDARGVFNLGSREGMSKADFAVSIGQRFGLSLDALKRCKSTELRNRAPRALDLTMDVDLIEKTFNIVMPSLAEEIARL
jgi:dTDP-4-dehydrorhamnose reductase